MKTDVKNNFFEGSHLKITYNDEPVVYYYRQFINDNGVVSVRFSQEVFNEELKNIFMFYDKLLAE